MEAHATPADDGSALDRECAVFGRLLCGMEPGPYVLDRYRRAHALGVVDPPGGAGTFDRALVRVARAAPWSARAADGYARLFASSTLLRRKLVLLLAILECSPSHHAAIDRPRAGTRAGFVLRAGLSAAAFGATTIAAAAVLAPLQAACALAGRRPARPRRA